MAAKLFAGEQVRVDGFTSKKGTTFGADVKIDVREWNGKKSTALNSVFKNR